MKGTLLAQYVEIEDDMAALMMRHHHFVDTRLLKVGRGGAYHCSMRFRFEPSANGRARTARDIFRREYFSDFEVLYIMMRPMR